MNLYGGMGKGERNRIKTRVRTAMNAQVALDGKYQGGRPPYGYRLADAGPHPNPAKALDGKRLRVLEPHPDYALVVQRIYAEFLARRRHQSHRLSAHRRWRPLAQRIGS